MNTLTRGQIWMFASFVAMAAMLATTFFLKGDVQTFAYILISLAFAAFAVLMSNREKVKRNS